MSEMVESIGGLLHVAQDVGSLMGIFVFLMRALSLASDFIANWFWEIVTCFFVALMFKYGQAWCMHIYHGYSLSAAQLTDGEAWDHLVVAFWAALGGGAVGLVGWGLVVNKGRRA